MPNPIALVVGDSHIEELIWRDRPDLRGDAFHGFSQCVDYAIANNLPLILAGDIVETLPADCPTSTTISFLQRQLSKLAAANIKVFNIYGQHDRAVPSWLKACHPEAVQDADGQYFDIAGFRTFFMSWRDREQAREYAYEIEPGTDILIAHQHWAELMGGSSFDLTAAKVPHVKLIISGDYHRLLRKDCLNTQGQPVSIYSPGSTHMRKINEPTVHYALIINDDLSVDSLALESRVVIETRIAVPGDVDHAISLWPDVLEEAQTTAESLPNELKKPIYVIKDGLTDGEAWVKLSTVVGDAAHIFYQSTKEILPDTGPADDIQPTVNELERVLWFLSKEVPDTSFEYQLISTMLQSDNAKASLTNICESFYARK